MADENILAISKVVLSSQLTHFFTKGTYISCGALQITFHKLKFSPVQFLFLTLYMTLYFHILGSN